MERLFVFFFTICLFYPRNEKTIRMSVKLRFQCRSVYVPALNHIEFLMNEWYIGDKNEEMIPFSTQKYRWIGIEKIVGSKNHFILF